MSREKWGFGRVFRRSNGRWYTYLWDGRDRPESVAKALHLPWQQVTEADARRRLKQRLKDKWTDRTVEPKTGRLRVRELLDAYVMALEVKAYEKARAVTDDEPQALEVRAARSLRVMRNEIAAVTTWLGEELVVRLTKSRLTELVHKYQHQGHVVKGERRRFAPGTVRTRLAVLHAAMVYGADTLGLPPVPRFPTLTVDNARERVPTAEEVDQLEQQLRAYDPGDDIVTHGRLTGWRISEVLEFKWPRVNLPGKEIQLRRVDRKTGKPLWRPLDGQPALVALLEKRWAQRAIGCPFVYHRGGQEVTYSAFNRWWRGACARLGLVDLRFHDLRRFAYRELADAGVPEEVAMKLVGHDSLETVRRFYKPVDRRSLTAALLQLTAYQSRERNSRKTRAIGDAGTADSPS